MCSAELSQTFVVHVIHFIRYCEFQQNKFLRELILSHNRFGQEAGEILGPAIGELVKIDL